VVGQRVGTDCLLQWERQAELSVCGGCNCGLAAGVSTALSACYKLATACNVFNLW